MKAFPYFDTPGLQQKFATLYGKDYKKEQDRETDELDDGIVMPPIRLKGNYHKHSYGVLDKELRYCTRSSIWEKPFHEYTVPPEIPFIDKEVIFCGALYRQYGHFLLEATSRLYYILEHNQEAPYLCYCAEEEGLASYAQDFFQLLGISTDHIIIVTQYTRFRKVIVPSLSFSWWKHYTPQFLMPFRKAASHIKPAPYERIYISRRNCNAISRIYGEKEIEKAFTQNGFVSIEPQNLTLEEQIALFKGAKVIAGINGTALHNIVFADQQPDLIILNRTEDADVQYILNAAAGINNCYIIKAYDNPLPVCHSFGPHIMGITPELKRFFQDYNLQVNNSDFTPYQYLPLFISRYLEVYSSPENRQRQELQSKDCMGSNDAAWLICQCLVTPPLYLLFIYYAILYIFSKDKMEAKLQYRTYRELKHYQKKAKQATRASLPRTL